MSNNVIGVLPNEICDVDANLDDMTGDVFFTQTLDGPPVFYMLIKEAASALHFMVNIHTGVFDYVPDVSYLDENFHRTTYTQMEMQ